MFKNKLTPLTCLLFILLGSTTILSCSKNQTVQKSRELSALESLKIRDQIENDYLIIRDPSLESFLEQLTLRLTFKNYLGVKVEIAKSENAFAHSFPTGVVLLSTALVERCNSEAEFAFILAHELGHVVLGHHSTAISSLDLGELKRRELAADSFGVEAIGKAGYSVGAAFTSIQRMNSIWDFYGEQQTSGYPSSAERLMRLQSKIVDQSCLITGRCLAGGIDNSREFERFRRRLRELGS